MKNRDLFCVILQLIISLFFLFLMGFNKDILKTKLVNEDNDFEEKVEDLIDNRINNIEKQMCELNSELNTITDKYVPKSEMSIQEKMNKYPAEVVSSFAFYQEPGDALGQVTKFDWISSQDYISNSKQLFVIKIYNPLVKIVMYGYDKHKSFVSSLELDSTQNLIDLSLHNEFVYVRFGVVGSRVSPSENVDFSISEINEGKINADLFGAVGDGVTDDTDAINQAILYGERSGRTVTLTSSNTYIVSQILIGSYLNFDGCNATLRGSCEQAILRINNEKNKYSGVIENITLDCNYLSSGLDVEQDWLRTYRNIYIRNIKDDGFGLYFRKGGGNVFTDIIGRYDDQWCMNHQCTGRFIVIQAPDSTFTNVNYQYYRYGIDVIAGNVLMTNIHGYLSKYQMYEGSYFIQIHPWADIVANLVYADTTESMFLFTDTTDYTGTGKQILVINGLHTFWTGDYGFDNYDYSQPYIFKFGNEDRAFVSVLGGSLRSFDGKAKGQKNLKLCNKNREKIELQGIIVTDVIME